jgi:hypothetical protein
MGMESNFKNSFANYLITLNGELVGNIHATNNHFHPYKYVVSIGDMWYGRDTLGAAIRTAIRCMPKGASLVVA